MSSLSLEWPNYDTRPPRAEPNGAAGGSSHETQLPGGDVDQVARDDSTTERERVEANSRTAAEQARLALEEELAAFEKTCMDEAKQKFENYKRKREDEVRKENETRVKKAMAEHSAKVQLEKIAKEQANKTNTLGLLLLIRMISFMCRLGRTSEKVVDPRYAANNLQAISCNGLHEDGVSSGKLGGYGFKLDVENGDHILVLTLSKSSLSNLLSISSHCDSALSICMGFVTKADSKINLSKMHENIRNIRNTDIDVKAVCSIIEDFWVAVDKKALGSEIYTELVMQEDIQYTQIESSVEHEYPLLDSNHLISICEAIMRQYVSPSAALPRV
jgi:hypothetical protein